MLKRKIGNSAPMTPLGIGAMSFANFYGPTNEENSHAVLDTARDLDITHIDTSNVYGMGGSETQIGTYLKKIPASEAQKFHIATKAGITTDENGKRCFKNSLEHLESELDQSLARMGIEAVDLFYVHRREAERPIEEITENLAALVKKGKAKSVGFSEIAPTTLERAQAIHPIAAVQSEYSLQTRSPEMGLIQKCAATGTAMVAFSPVGRSLLTDAPHPLEHVKTLPFLSINPRFSEENLPLNMAASQPLRALAADWGVPTAAIAIAWIVAKSSATFPIPGTRSTQHLKDLHKGLELALSSDDIAEIERRLPIGWAHGDRYDAVQWVGPERYC